MVKELETDMKDNKARCCWCGDIPIYVDYHDNEWGRPVHDDKKLFEMLTLEGAQAGLSWLTILKKRENYRTAFDNFDPAKIALYNDDKIKELLANPGIIRNRLKINATITNAKAVLHIQKEHDSLDKYLWSYVDYKPITNHFEKIQDFITTSPISDKISKDLKKRGMNFVGSTIIYAFMQATGMVNDHFTDCFVYEELTKETS
ncbi:MAG: DNA-3-methyladenine glycosylase I [Candidatus Bathyarchaeota archaeon]|nr:DNA-3-methyladenine glycosylase I [Candidatus Termiticorpusculum sp.]